MRLTKDFNKELVQLSQLLGADTAIISCITGQVYEVLAVASKLSTLRPGDQFETRNTYCNQVMTYQRTVTYAQVGTDKAMVLHPVYTAMQLEAYVGEPLFKDGVIVGTLNFSAFLPKKPDFSLTELEQVGTLARAIESALV